MRIPDTNVLVNSVNRDAPQQPSAHAWIESALSGTEPVGLAVVAILGFVRITTSPRIFPRPLTVAAALDQVDAWLAPAAAMIIEPGRRHLRILRNLLEASGTAGNLTTDAHLAAIAIEHAATLASFDGDMHRFSGLKLEYLR